MKHRDLTKKLTDAGFIKVRDDGNHTIYANPATAKYKSRDTEKSMKIQQELS